MRLSKFIAPAVILFVGFVVNSSLSHAKMEYTKKEKKPCATCHVSANSKELNDTGKFYKEKKTLEGAPKSEKAADKK